MNRQFRILLVEDDPSDALLALTMVNEVNLASKAFSLEIKALGPCSFVSVQGLLECTQGASVASMRTTASRKKPPPCSHCRISGAASGGMSPRRAKSRSTRVTRRAGQGPAQGLKSRRTRGSPLRGSDLCPSLRLVARRRCPRRTEQPSFVKLHPFPLGTEDTIDDRTMKVEVGIQRRAVWSNFAHQTWTSSPLSTGVFGLPLSVRAIKQAALESEHLSLPEAFAARYERD